MQLPVGPVTVLTELTNKGAASSWTRDSLRRAVVSTHDRAVVRTPDRAVVSNLNRACLDRDRESKPRPESQPLFQLELDRLKESTVSSIDVQQAVYEAPPPPPAVSLPCAPSGGVPAWVLARCRGCRSDGGDRPRVRGDRVARVGLPRDRYTFGCGARAFVGAGAPRGARALLL